MGTHAKKNKSTLSEKVKIIPGKYDKYKDWVQDKKGYFLIRVNKKKRLIEVGFCKKNNVVELIVQGKIPQELYFTIFKKNLVSRWEHAAYLGRELEKAYLALKYNLSYVQDDELDINAKIKK